MPLICFAWHFLTYSCIACIAQFSFCCRFRFVLVSFSPLVSVLQSRLLRNSIQTKNLLELCNLNMAHAWWSFNLQNQCQIFSIRCKLIKPNMQLKASWTLQPLWCSAACSLLVLTRIFFRWTSTTTTNYSYHIFFPRRDLVEMLENWVCNAVIFFFISNCKVLLASECRLSHMWKFWEIQHNVIRIVSQHLNANVKCKTRFICTQYAHFWYTQN